MRFFRKKKEPTPPSDATPEQSINLPWFQKINQLLFKRYQIDDDTLHEIKKQLIRADVGMATTNAILADFTKHAKKANAQENADLSDIMQKTLINKLPETQALQLDAALNIVLLVGVNGSGKTTTLAKIAHRFRNSHSILFAAGDTFRAAAIEQLKAWASDLSLPIIAQQLGADSAAVLFDSVKAAQSRGHNLLLADTAGRLQNKKHLMQELEKCIKTIGKAAPNSQPHILLVLDANTGQNGLEQAKQFHEHLNINGLIITKLDGSAKGGIIFAIKDLLNLPVYFVGQGEKLEDLAPFNPQVFAENLLNHGVTTDRSDA